MILLAPENSFITLHMRWHKGCFPKTSTKTSSTIARLQALADANTAKEEAQYTCLMAERQLECKTRDAETGRIRQEERAQFEKDMAILGVDKRAAIANAKLTLPKLNER